MSDYRLYFLDGTGKFSFGQWIEADDDIAALEKVRSFASEARKCELWQCNRLVGSFNVRDLTVAMRKGRQARKLHLQCASSGRTPYWKRIPAQVPLPERGAA